MEPVIRLEHISKVYNGKDNQIVALEDVSLDIEKGDIYGIIGMSGAGKSTLVRCLNYLERPTSGHVRIDGKDLSDLSDKQLRQARSDIAMIFQHFNLLMQRNVLDNICFPLELAGIKKKQAREKAKELLKLVGLSEKEKAYPSQLSGGQKQRVAIARALAVDPKILLCDEATSALDPETTQSILKLLQSINRELGITIVIITHEMTVVQQICTHVAILDHGHLAETGTVSAIFASPKTQAGRRLVESGDRTAATIEGTRNIRIVFEGSSSFEPVVANVILSVGKPLNILYADTRNINGTAYGEMILGLPKEHETAEKIIAAFQNRDIKVEEVDTDAVDA